MSRSSIRDAVINDKVQEALIREFNRRMEDDETSSDPLVVARWFSLDGIEYYGLDMSPDRPSVVFGCVMLPPEWGGGWEFSTFWLIREEGNPLSHGEALEDQRVPVNISGIKFEFPRWELDLYWEPVRLEELTRRLKGLDAI